MMSPEGNSAPASEERSLKRKASSSLSTLLARLSSFGSFGSRTSQGDEPPTPGAFALRLRKVMCVIGLTSEDSVAQPQQQEPSPDLAGFDELSPADLDDLIGKAFPLEPPVLQQKSSLDLSRLVDLTQLERDSLESLRSAAGMEPEDEEQETADESAALGAWAPDGPRPTRVGQGRA